MRRDPSTSTDCAAVWHVQSGRSRVQRVCAADGFRTEYPYTGVVAIAENCSTDDDGSSRIAVETVRDVFAEGVAFGVEDALRDSFDEASEAIKSRGAAGCSAAALAFSATHIWYALAGNCRIYRIDDDGVKCIVRDRSSAGRSQLSLEHPEFMKQVRSMEWWLGAPGQGKPILGHTRIRKDTTYLIMTSGSWVQFEHGSPVLARKGLRRTLHGWITSLSRDLKLAYRRQGGALGAVSGTTARPGGGISWKAVGITAVCLALAWLLISGRSFSCSGNIDPPSDLFAPSADSVETVQPIQIEPDSAAEAEAGDQGGILEFFPDSLQDDSVEVLLPDLSASLPLNIAWVGTDADSLPPDSFRVSVNDEPDPQWENFAPGIYFIANDTASVYLSEVASRLYPDLERVELLRMITVRENGVTESARWLSSLPEELAAGTGVIVETRSSVAGGADWIRNYPVFANGDRAENADEPGGFFGDSLEAIPVLRSENSYRLIVVTAR